MNGARVRWMAAIALLLITTGAAAQVYRWTDANGSTVYGDKPPPGVKAHKVEREVSVVPRFDIDAAATQAPRATAPPAAPVETRPAATGEAPGESHAERRARMIARCKANRGVDCENRVDALLDGSDLLPGNAVWGRRYHWPVPPIAPKPEPKPKQREPLAAPMPGTVPRKPITQP